MGVSRLAALLLAGALVAAGCGGNEQVLPNADEGAPRAEVVEFTTEDGVDLTGLSFGSGDTAVVLAHMRGSGKEAWTDVADALAKNGFVAFAFDFRGYGGTEGERDTSLELDLTAAITAIRAEGAAKVFVVGASMGATAALSAAAQHKLEGVVAVSGSFEFDGIDAYEAAASIEEPSLFIASADDRPYAAETSALADVAGGRFVEYAGAAHGTDIINEQREKISAQIVRFVQDPAAEAGAAPAP